MKWFLAIIVIFATTISSASEKAYHYNTVVEKFYSLQSSSTLDLTNYSKNLIAGRCFYNNSQIATGAAIIVYTRNNDSGPIGQPDEKVAMGVFITSNDQKIFDNENFDSLYYRPNSTIKERFTETSYNSNLNNSYLANLSLRSDSDGIIYGVRTFNSDSSEMACYFYRNNY